MRTAIMETADSRPDLRLVSPSENEEGRAWDAVYRETVVMVFRFIYARVGNRPDAEDLTTQVYMRALPRLRLRASPQEVRSYLVATARTILADHWRRHYDIHFTELDDMIGPPQQRREYAAEGESGARRAAEILERLPDNYRMILELRFLRGYSIRETATAMKISVTNAKVMQFRALRRAAAVGAEAYS